MNEILSMPPIVRGDLFQQCCDHIFWNNEQPMANANFEAGSVVFCKIDEVLSFFEQLRLTRKRIILITGEGDFPCDAFRQQFLPKNVAHWFSTNVTHAHPRVSAIPLGLGTPHDPVTLKTSKLLVAQENKKPKNQWLLISFRPETNLGIRQKIYTYFQHRSQQEPWITFAPPQSDASQELFLTQLAHHHFVLCPPGNGVDTHRLWETLTAGSYPVVLKSQAMEPFKDLPILFIDQVEDITLDFLQTSLPELKMKEKSLFMLKMSFWEKKIQEAKRSLRKRELMPWKEWTYELILYGQKMLCRKLLAVSIILKK